MILADNRTAVLEQVLQKVNNGLRLHNNKYPGLLDGQLGILLYKATIAHTYKNTVLQQEVEAAFEEVLNNAFEDPFSVVSGFGLNRGILGLLQLRQLLIEYGFYISDEFSFTEFDEYIFEWTVNMFNEKNLDYLHGAFGAVNYFACSKQPGTALKFVPYIYKCIENKFIQSITVNHERGVLDTSLVHGETGFLLVMLRLIQADPENTQLRDVSRALIYTLINTSSGSNDDEKNKTLFPRYILPGGSFDYTPKYAWCIGDLGITYMLFKAAEVLNDGFIYEFAVKIAPVISNKSFEMNDKRNNPFFCHGTSGVIHMYEHLYEISKLEIFKEKSSFWQDVLISELNELDPDYFDSSILNGNIGIALVLNNLINNDNKSLWSNNIFLV